MVAVIVITLAGCEKEQDSSTKLTDFEVNDYINEHDIRVIKLIKTTNNEHYLFYKNENQAVINVLKGKQNGGILMSNSVRDFSDDLIMIGGIEDGSFGIWIENDPTVQSASYFTATINNKYILFFKLIEGEKYYVFEDSKIHYNDLIDIHFFDTDHQPLAEKENIVKENMAGVNITKKEAAESYIKMLANNDITAILEILTPEVLGRDTTDYGTQPMTLEEAEEMGLLKKGDRFVRSYESIASQITMQHEIVKRSFGDNSWDSVTYTFEKRTPSDGRTGYIDRITNKEITELEYEELTGKI